MADITLSYKGSTIAEISDSATKTMNTAGKYCEDDITLVYAKPPAGNQFTLTVSVDSGSTVTATDGTSTVTGTSVNDECVLTLPNAGTWTVTATLNGETSSKTVSIIDDYYETITFTDPVLERNSWQQISNASVAGQAANLWSVGDKKSVALSGTCGVLELNTTLDCYIIGFNHNSALEGTGIHFGTWKNTRDVSLNINYNSTYSNGYKSFTINHWGTSSSPYNTNYGGWAGCDLRYDILGSTDIAPSGYGSTPTTSRTGYNASSTTATNPVPNTLMSCLPSDLRAVLKPMTKYTDNYGNSSATEQHVTSTIDYLPLLAEYEIHGSITYANNYEKNKQAQYEYYIAGNSKIKYIIGSTAASYWWSRSPRRNSNYAFCETRDTGAAHANASRISYGIAPCFKV